MKRKFALPIAVALILHAALLFGFGGTPEAVQRGDILVSYGSIDEMPTTIEMVDFPEPLESAVGEDPAEEIKGDPDAQNVSLPDFPRPAPDKSFTIPVEPFEAVSHERMTQIKSGIRGALDGAVDGVFRTGDSITSGMLDSSPRVIVQTSPLYPGEAKIHGIEGRVLLGFMVDESGHVIAPYVINRTDRRFEEAALRAVSKWRFEPGRRHGRVVRFRMAVPMIFSLND